MNISKPSVNKSNTGVRTLISHHNRRTLVTLKILFFDESHARCVRFGRSAYNTTDHSGVLHAHMITNLYIDWYRSRVGLKKKRQHYTVVQLKTDVTRGLRQQPEISTVFYYGCSFKCQIKITSHFTSKRFQFHGINLSLLY